MSGSAEVSLEQRIREIALETGFDRCRLTHADPPETWEHYQRWIQAGNHGRMGYLERHTEKKGDLQRVLEGVRSVICLAISYHVPASAEDPRSSVDPSPLSGTVARYARHLDYHDVLKPALESFCSRLDEISGGEGRHLAYLDTGPIMERDLAQRAGLGFVGKHTNLIHRGLGNWFFIAEILTTLELTPDDSEPNRCGTCTRCMEACPTQAIEAPFQLNAQKCIAYLTIELKGSIPEALRPAIGDRIFGCDDCLAVCPWNRFAREGRLMKEAYRKALNAPDLIDWLSMDAPTFKQVFAGTPMMRSKRRGMLRNICVALGNRRDPRALPALEKAALDEDPIIAEHAQWAVKQIQSPPH